MVFTLGSLNFFECSWRCFCLGFCGSLLLLAVRPARRAFSFETSVDMGGECFLFNYFCGLQGRAQQDGKKDTMKTCVSRL